MSKATSLLSGPSDGTVNTFGELGSLVLPGFTSGVGGGGGRNAFGANPPERLRSAAASDAAPVGTAR